MPRKGMVECCGIASNRIESNGIGPQKMAGAYFASNNRHNVPEE
jgi:hypothetical protein